MTLVEVEAPGSRSPRAVITLLVATLGLGLNLRASLLLGPHLHERFDLGPGRYAILIGLPLLVAAMVRLPAGVLTDRYGARVMFPAVSLAAAASVVAVGLAGSLPAVVIAGTAGGVAGAAFVVGGALVSRTFSYGRRGRALGVFSLGAAVAAVLSGASRGFDPEGRRSAVLLGVLLVAFAALAAVALRDRGAVHRAGSPAHRGIDLIRMAATSSLSLLYLLALGSIMSVAVYLPIYLVTTFRLEWVHALGVTGAAVALAILARLAGGWWTDRRPTTRLLVLCYGVAAALCLVGALAPRLWWLVAPVIAGIAVCDGLASGALLALIGKAARPDSAGAVMGVTGAAGAVGALLPPVLLVVVHGVTQSYSAAWTLLAAMLLASALYVRKNDLHIGMGFAVQFEPEPSPTTMTVAVLDESDTRLGAAAVVARLAELATSDELLVVYGADERARTRAGAHTLVAGLRDRLPRYSVVAVRLGPDTAALGHEALLLGEYVDAGTLAIAVTPTVDPRSVAVDLSIYLQADRVLRVSYTPATGAELHPV
jgi:NNP family nitrate/nitrite transporter-like MFS transporter